MLFRWMNFWATHFSCLRCVTPFVYWHLDFIYQRCYFYYLNLVKNTIASWIVEFFKKNSLSSLAVLFVLIPQPMFSGTSNVSHMSAPQFFEKIWKFEEFQKNKDLNKEPAYLVEVKERVDGCGEMRKLFIKFFNQTTLSFSSLQLGLLLANMLQFLLLKFLSNTLPKTWNLLNLTSVDIPK